MPKPGQTQLGARDVLYDHSAGIHTTFEPYAVWSDMIGFARVDEYS